MVGQRSQEIYTAQEAGEFLRRRRQRQRLSLETASRQLNISVKHLAAIESGDLSVFSAAVYARGAFAQYARWLGIDDRAAERMILRALSDTDKAVVFRVHMPETLWERMMTPRLVLLVAGLALASLIGGYITWQLRSFWQLPDLALLAPETAVVTSDTVTVRGFSEPEAQVTVNGQSILLKDDQSFEVEVRLRPGVNVIRGEAANAAGRVRAVEKHLLRPRSGGTLK